MTSKEKKESCEKIPYELTPAHVKMLSLGQFELDQRLIDKFIYYSKNIKSDNLGRRIIAQTMLRGEDERYFPGQGSIFLPFVIQNRKAIEQLVNNLGNATILLAPERGGGLVLDHIKNVLPGIESHKITKFSQASQDAFELNEAIRELQRYPWSKIAERKISSENALRYSKDEHSARLEEAIISAIEAGHKTIALADTMVSGASAWYLIKVIQRVLCKYPMTKFKLLLHQHTIEIDGAYGHPKAYPLPYGGGKIKISKDSSFSIKGSSLIRPNFSNNMSREERKKLGIQWKNNEYNSYGEITIANGNDSEGITKFNSILGEDVEFQLQNSGGSLCQKPFFVFGLNEQGSINVVKLQPSAGSTARNALGMLIAGDFDVGLKANGIVIEKEAHKSILKPKDNEPQKLPLFSYVEKKKCDIASIEQKKIATANRLNAASSERNASDCKRKLKKAANSCETFETFLATAKDNRNKFFNRPAKIAGSKEIGNNKSSDAFTVSVRPNVLKHR